MKSTDFYCVFVRAEMNLIAFFGSKQLLSAQKNHLNETFFSTHKNVRVGREQNFYYTFFTFTVCHCND